MIAKFNTFLKELAQPTDCILCYWSRVFGLVIAVTTLLHYFPFLNGWLFWVSVAGTIVLWAMAAVITLADDAHPEEHDIYPQSQRYDG